MAESVRGVRQFIAALDDVGPDLDKATMKELRRVAAHAATWARASYPATDAVPSGFAYVNKSGNAPVSRTGRARAFPRYVRSQAQDGVKVTTRQGKRKTRTVGRNRYGFVNAIGIAVDDPAAAILETAGTKNAGGNTSAGGRLIQGLAAATGVGVPLYKVVLPKIIDSRSDIDRIVAKMDSSLTKVGR
jgi:hypothetical protein